MGPLILCCWSQAIPPSQKIKQIKSRSLLSFMVVASRSQLNWLWKTLWEALIFNSRGELSQSYTFHLQSHTIRLQPPCSCVCVHVYRRTSSLSAHRQHKHGKSLLDIEGLSCYLNLKDTWNPPKKIKQKTNAKKKTLYLYCWIYLLAPSYAAFIVLLSCYTAARLPGCNTTSHQPVSPQQLSWLTRVAELALPNEQQPEPPSAFSSFSHRWTHQKKKQQQTNNNNKTAEILGKHY